MYLLFEMKGVLLFDNLFIIIHPLYTHDFEIMY